MIDDNIAGAPAKNTVNTSTLNNFLIYETRIAIGIKGGERRGFCAAGKTEEPRKNGQHDFCACLCVWRIVGVCAIVGICVVANATV